MNIVILSMFNTQTPIYIGSQYIGVGVLYGNPNKWMIMHGLQLLAIACNTFRIS
jgi:hypothetical protein